MTPSHSWHDVTSHIVCHDSFTQLVRYIASHMWRSHGTQWCHVTNNILRRRCVPWLLHTAGTIYRVIHVCDKTHSYVGHDSLIRVTWNLHMCDMTHSYVTRYIVLHMWRSHGTQWDCHHICDVIVCQLCAMTHSFVWHDSSMCVQLRIFMCDRIRSYVCRDSF